MYVTYHASKWQSLNTINRLLYNHLRFHVEHGRSNITSHNRHISSISTQPEHRLEVLFLWIAFILQHLGKFFSVHATSYASITNWTLANFDKPGTAKNTFWLIKYNALI